jgi:ADP-L-glycero-D-manno-heptose 6-epimerase
MIIVTGGAGFIGSNIIAQLNIQGITNILVVDHLQNGRKIFNLSDLNFCDYLDRDDFLNKILSGYDFGHVEAVFHSGACSSTTEWDGKFIMDNNFEYSKKLLHWCQLIGAQYLYASSASVYGLGNNGFEVDRRSEMPLNAYAFSKFQFDQYVRSLAGQLKYQVVGFRYFNVYGPREAHKGSMSSTPYHFNNQIIAMGKCQLFAGIDGYENGEQKRDFVYVEDVAAVNIWFFRNKTISGIFNVGTGRAQSFNEVAKAVIDWHNRYQKMTIGVEYIPFPEAFRGSYQNYTQADISGLRSVGYHRNFHCVKDGVSKYLNWLNSDLLKV